MLKRLMISNYALIKEVDISFDEGLTIITGETGAGKSIMLGALSLLLGSRADSRVIGDRSRKTIVEATFSADEGLRELFDTHGLDWDSEVIIRREITSSGRSRAFINDTPVNLKLLGEVTSLLVDIHSQNSNMMLRDSRRQLAIIDALADDKQELEEYKELFREFVRRRNRLRDAKAEVSRNRENEQFLRFQLSQLEKLKPRRGELAELERQSEILGDAEDIKMRLGEALTLLDDGEESTVTKLTEARHLLSRVNFSLLEIEDDESGTPSLAQRLESVYLELKDITLSLESTLERIDNDPDRLERVEKRMSDLYEAMKRFNVSTDAELADIHTGLRDQLASLGTSDTDIETMESDLKEQGRMMREAAERLSEKRALAAERFSKLLVDTARPLGMANLKFSAMLSKGKFGADGQDNICFLCSFNKNQDLMPAAEIASGGETSRLMLSIKGIIARHVSLPSIIFDEVDTGVSGEVANRIGEMMRELGDRIQVIAITHLPQVASKGANHYKVYKADEDERTVTHISLLNRKEREQEIAVMLSGSSVDDAALANARSLLSK